MKTELLALQDQLHNLNASCRAFTALGYLIDRPGAEEQTPALSYAEIHCLLSSLSAQLMREMSQAIKLVEVAASLGIDTNPGLAQTQKMRHSEKAVSQP